MEENMTSEDEVDDYVNDFLSNKAKDCHRDDDNPNQIQHDKCGVSKIYKFFYLKYTLLKSYEINTN